MNPSIEIKSLGESKNKNKCKLHTIKLARDGVVKLSVCDGIEFYSDVNLFIQPHDNDADILAEFFEGVIASYRAELENCKAELEAYNSHIPDYSNKVVFDLFTLVHNAKTLKSKIMSVESELEKIGKEFESVELMEQIIDMAELKEEISHSAEMISDVMNLVSTLNNNDTNNLMKRLTAITVIFTPLNLLAGIGGMSEWSGFVAFLGCGGFWGYVLFFAIIAAVGYSAYRYISKIR
jgi:magnesium transporter